MFKNMKIPVKNNLDEIVAELEQKGYTRRSVSVGRIRFAFSCETGVYDLFYGDYDFNCKPTTLAKLKEM